MDAKQRRKALGLSRAQLAGTAHVDKNILQLIELGHATDVPSADRVSRALDALENDSEMPDFAAEVEADVAATGTVTSDR
jgi:transcriptional regulator with XRE-family HTH domain